MKTCMDGVLVGENLDCARCGATFTEPCRGAQARAQIAALARQMNQPDRRTIEAVPAGMQNTQQR